MSTPEVGTPRPAKAPDEKVAKNALKAFLAMDRDNDGHLSLEEFRSGLGTLGLDLEFVHILFNSFDKDGSGTIEKKEFLAAMAVMLHPDDTDEQIGMVFDSYDSNKDGKLQIEELQHVISAIFATMEKMGIKEPTADPVRTCTELYNAMDVDSKGFVTKEDYIRLAKINPDLLKKIGLGGPRVGPRSISRVRSATSTSGTASAGTLYGVPQRHGDDTPRSRKRGTTVSFGHDNWELVVQMMLAIRLSVARSRQLSLEVVERKSSPGSASAAKPMVPQGEVPTAVLQSQGPLRTKKEAKLDASSSICTNSTAAASSQQPSASLSPTAAHYQDVWKTKIPGCAPGRHRSYDVVALACARAPCTLG
uniref:EF-hand domain-containing protein n=1 Tax=Haptolina brevifila TaxID=156173 RepID=A0A7S2JKK7_9EUKA|mmetsp:Transcript_84699/g.169160  ORF Transcript_84699/g.169160 Transcript_84699/m.169160 type:complete len:363 (+) Transcript_84699:111-1199(+)